VWSREPAYQPRSSSIKWSFESRGHPSNCRRQGKHEWVARIWELENRLKPSAYQVIVVFGYQLSDLCRPLDQEVVGQSVLLLLLLTAANLWIRLAVSVPCNDVGINRNRTSDRNNIVAESCTSLETLIVPVLPDSGSTLYRIEPRRRGCAGRVRSELILLSIRRWRLTMCD